MATYADFKEYLQDVYGQDISEPLEEFAIENPDRVGLEDYYKIEDLEIVDLRVTGATFKALDEDRIEIRTTVNAGVEFSGIYQGERDYYPETIKANVIINATLRDGLNDFEIVGVKEYDDFYFQKDKSLSQNMVPYLYEEDVEKVAEDFLQRNYREALEGSMALPVEELAKKMGLMILYGPLDSSTFGRMYFEDDEVDIYPLAAVENYEAIERVTVQKGTMIVNPTLCFLRGIGSMNNTIVHECVHWDRHRKAFELWKLLQGGISHISCEEVAGDYQGIKADEDALKWMEWQANQLAPRILMPRNAVLREMNNLWESAHFHNPDAGLADVFQMMVESLAKFFKVSRLAAKIRLLDLGFDQAEGACVYINGESIPAYTFPKGTLELGQTFLIDEWNAMRVIMANRELRALYFSDKIVYAHGLVCINDPKYVFYNESGKYRLTDYARDHVNECCFVFRRDLSASDKYSDTYYRICYLCRDAKDIEYVDVAFDFSRNKDLIEDAKEISETMSSLHEAIKRIESYGFSDTLIYHMDGKHITEGRLAELCGTSTNTVSRWRGLTNDPDISLGLALCLCNALELHPEYARDLLRKKSYDLTAHSLNNMVIRGLIDNHVGESIEAWQHTLDKMGTGIILQSWKQRKPDPKKKE